MSDVASKKQKVVTPPELLQGLQLVSTQERAGNLSQAVNLCNDLLKKFPEHPIVLHYLGVLHLQLKEIQSAIDYLERAIKKNKKQAASLNYLGIAYCQLNDIPKGISLYKKALKIEPRLHETHYNLAIALINQEKLNEAERHLKEALKLNFVSPGLHYNLGYLLHQRNERDQAIKHYKEALRLHPNYFQCLNNLGEALTEKGENEEAVTIYEKLAQVYPEPSVYQKLGVIYGTLGHHEKAIEVLEKIDNKKEEIFYLLGTNYWSAGNFEKTAEAYREGLKYHPHNLTFLLSLIQTIRVLCDWSEHDKLLSQLFENIDNEDYLYKFAHYFIFGFSIKDELKFARRIASYYESKISEIKHKLNFNHSRKMNKKLRVGYLSANVKSHANAYTITNLFPNHDKEKFDITLYSAGKTDSSPVAKELMETAPNFVDLSTLTVVDAAQKIYEDGIDILIDFTAYNNSFSSCILAAKAAKVQIGFMGHCGTRGADYIDFIFIDQTVVPVEEAQYFHEKLIYLPHTFFIANDKLPPHDMTREELNLPTDKIVLTCINHVQKYEPRSFAAWMKILERVPNSILVLWVSQYKQAEKYLLQHAEKCGMKDRVYFTPELGKPKHLGRLKVLDLFLDSFDCTAQSTAIDALAVGLPIVTLYGNNVASRGASSILKAMGMSDLITYSVEEYIEKAVYFATNENERNQLREKILANKLTQPLFDCKGYVQKLEEAFLMIRDNYEKQVTENIFVNP